MRERRISIIKIKVVPLSKRKSLSLYEILRSEFQELVLTVLACFLDRQAESEVAALNRKVQMIEEDLERSEERSGTATTKLAEASQAADEANR